MLDTLPFATVQITQSMLPTGQLELVRSRAQSGAFAELESLLWFRENVDDWRKEKVLMQAYKEYAARDEALNKYHGEYAQVGK